MSPRIEDAGMDIDTPFSPIHIAVCGWRPSPLVAGAVALAACAFAMPVPAADSLRVEIQLTPSGEFTTSDGRELPVAAWRIDAAAAQRVIARYQARLNPAVLDYEHQTLRAEQNGQPAPAAGWIQALTWREGSGLWATVELTERAASLIRNGEYKFVSPVFAFDGDTGEVLAVLMAAITNNPAIDGMAPLELVAAATFGVLALNSPFNHQESRSMNKLLAALCAALGLDVAKTTEDQAVAACTALKIRLDALDKIGAEVGVQEVGDGAAVIAACTALKTQASAATKATAPDPAQFVGIGVVEELKGQLAVLTARHVEREVGDLVESGMADGRLLEAQRQWATDLGKKDIAALSQYLKTAQPLAGLRSSQTDGKPPAGSTDEYGLTAAELAVCTATGIDPKAFAAAKV